MIACDAQSLCFFKSRPLAQTAPSRLHVDICGLCSCDERKMYESNTQPIPTLIFCLSFLHPPSYCASQTHRNDSKILQLIPLEARTNCSAPVLNNSGICLHHSSTFDHPLICVLSQSWFLSFFQSISIHPVTNRRNCTLDIGRLSSPSFAIICMLLV